MEGALGGSGEEVVGLDPSTLHCSSRGGEAGEEEGTGVALPGQTSQQSCPREGAEGERGPCLGDPTACAEVPSGVSYSGGLHLLVMPGGWYKPSVCVSPALWVGPSFTALEGFFSPIWAFGHAIWTCHFPSSGSLSGDSTSPPALLSLCAQRWGDASCWDALAPREE